MAGLYIHIPFCASRCSYCDFFSGTDLSLKNAFVAAACREMETRRAELAGETVKTVYIGGGTPSLLSPKELGTLFETICRLFPVEGGAEITLEANPDDLTTAYIAGLRPLPVNRISMGVQSFRDDDLRLLQRRHSREQAVRAVRDCREQGFENISIDLIYGLPGQTAERWASNLEEALRLEVAHLSAYHLTYEKGTPLYRLRKEKAIRPVDEEVSLSLFTRLADTLCRAGYVHYEISNFALPGCFSRHNSSYWTGEKYLGIGPSAHSYDGESRRWNVSSLPRYLRGIETNAPEYEAEQLDIHTRYNEYIITGLRMLRGISLSHLLAVYGPEKHSYCLAQALPSINHGLLLRENDTLRLSPKGLFVSDGLISNLLWV